MLTEVDVSGVYVSPFFITLMLAVPVFFACRWALMRLGVMTNIWYPPLFELGLFTIVLAFVTALS